jgi:hypothetical protein
MKKNLFKRFVLVGIFLVTSYLGFSQTAVFKVLSPQYPYMDEVLIELEYKKVGDSTVNSVTILPTWENLDDNGYFYFFFNLPGLEISETYEVRIRAYIVNGEYEGECGFWTMTRITMPIDGGDGFFDIVCQPVYTRYLVLNEFLSYEENFGVSDEGKTIKEAKKEE